MNKSLNRRYTQLAVNNFIFCGDEILMLKRKLTKRIDPGKLNCIGGKVEPGETFLEATIRETEEETGIILTPVKMSFVGILTIEGGYEEDWVNVFFRSQVESKKLPLGMNTEDGDFMWVASNEIHSGFYDLVDDLNYTFQYVLNGKMMFATMLMDESLKVTDTKISTFDAQ